MEGSLNHTCWLILLHAAIWNFTCRLCLLFYVSYLRRYHKTLRCNRILRRLSIFALICLLQNGYFQTPCAAPGLMNLTLLHCLFQVKWHSGRRLLYSSEFSESMWCDLAHYVTLLWCRNSRRRSLCQEFCFSLPRGLHLSIFLLQQVPRLYQCYLFIAFPSLPTRRHCWHWLRCA